MAPKLYGWQHLTYLAIFVVVFVGIILVAHFCCKTDKSKTILIKSVAGVLLVLILINRFAIAFMREHDASKILPDSYCGATSLLLAVWVLVAKPNNKAFHFMWYIGVFGGLATMLMPDFLGQASSFMYLPTISGMLHHSTLLILCALMLQTKWIEPNLKYWYCFPIGMSCYTLYGLFLMDIFKWENAMCINKPIINGTPINWWVITLAGTALIAGVLALVELIKKQRKKKAQQLPVTTNETKNK